MLVKTMPSVEAQNRFGFLIDTAQREVVSITRRGRPVAYVISPDIVQDWLDGQLATQAEKEGFLSVSESNNFLSHIRNANA
jgi:prevent-host-death family protein